MDGGVKPTSLFSAYVTRQLSGMVCDVCTSDKFFHNLIRACDGKLCDMVLLSSLKNCPQRGPNNGSLIGGAW